MKTPPVKIFILFFIAFAFTTISWVAVKNNDPASTKIADAEKVSPVSNNNLPAIQLFEQHIASIYEKAGLSASHLDYQIFKNAVTGYYNFKTANLIAVNNPIITIVDFNKPSTQKRLWIINLDSSKLLFNTLVAHGQGSGNNVAHSFSNKNNSHQSSLGFYITSDTYFGKHGLSMKLDGMDKNLNSNARERAVVIHGADYVSQDFISKHGRLGRSHGCPALPLELTQSIIDSIKGRTCLYIHGGGYKSYSSEFSNPEVAASGFLSSSSAISNM
ncbi:MAG TPA: murein L,D-transpeptidase catalytic domain family protein [Daejeonella sp.]|nr:murein L,D-transpeptidase catalytic domain family protein [Daejeonella sp.]